jgi:clan AA aspartic protease (TIGR02281 family)
MRNDNIIVRGVINNTVVCEFVVDTGASIVLLPYKVADRLSLINSNGQTFEATLANGEKVPAQLAILKKLQVGESYAENVQAGILLDRTRDYPGLLGMSFLKNFIIKINYNESKLQLEDFTPE